MKTMLYRTIFLFAALCVLIRCNEKGFPEAAYPRIITLPVTDIEPEGAMFHAQTIQAGTEEVINRGFVWAQDAGVTLQNGERIDVGPGDGDFDAHVTFGLVKGETYYVRAFVVTKTMLAYSPFVEFVSDGTFPPEIASISPMTGSLQDTVIIQGSRFSNIPGNNKVKFGDAVSSVIKSSESTIECVVPNDISNKPVRITVKVGTGETMSTEYFSLVAPIIYAFSPAQGTFGDEVTITGKNFSSSLYYNVIKFGAHTAQIVSASSGRLVVRVPSAIREKDNLISVTMGGLTAEASSNFSILAPVVTGLSVTKGKIGDDVTIIGSNFNGEPGATTVMLAGMQASVRSSTSSTVTFIVPRAAYSTRSLHLEVIVGGQSAPSPQELALQHPWIRIAEEVDDANGRSREVAFALNGSVYVGSGTYESSKFRRYIPSSNTWSQIAPFPGDERWGAVAFVIGNYGYVGLGQGGQTDFWRYDPAMNQWTRISDFPKTSTQSVAFSGNGKGYVVIAEDSDNFWEYNPSTNSWTKKPDCPSISLPGSLPSTGFTIGNDFYVYGSTVGGTASLVYRYSTVTSSWFSVASPYAGYSSQEETGFAIGGKGYIKSSYGLLTYTPSSDSWQLYYDSDPSGYRGYPVAVEAGNKIYFGAGSYEDWWEFDPTFE